ncbi:hypothetical protein J6590_104249 [Homalodisca vitripennis]|nr:hypothetical protein J6590_104249 [Homalodisca vitripennis]
MPVQWVRRTGSARDKADNCGSAAQDKADNYVYSRGLKLRDALDILTGEHDDENNQVESIYIGPPEPAVLTDEESADEDEGGLIENVLGKQLMAAAEIKFTDNTIISNMPSDGLTTNMENELPGESNDGPTTNMEDEVPGQSNDCLINNTVTGNIQSDLGNNSPTNNKDTPNTIENPQPTGARIIKNVNKSILFSTLMAEKRRSKIKREKNQFIRLGLMGTLNISTSRLSEI